MTTTTLSISAKRVLNPLVVLAALGLALALTNTLFPAVDDECAIIGQAAQPVSQTLHLYFSGAGEHEHPPLYDLILHAWLRLTGGEMHLLRLPAIVFYLLGAYALAAAAKRLAGEAGRTWVLILVVLWPFGFHFGRVAAWYSFCFFLVSLLTLGVPRLSGTAHACELDVGHRLRAAAGLFQLFWMGALGTAVARPCASAILEVWFANGDGSL